MTAALNTLRYANRLKAAGVEPAQAEAMTDALDAELMADLITKADLEQFEARREVKCAAIDARFEVIEGRLDNIDTRFKTTDERFKTVDERFKSLQFTMTGGFTISGILNAALRAPVALVLTGA